MLSGLLSGTTKTLKSIDLSDLIRSHSGHQWTWQDVNLEDLADSPPFFHQKNWIPTGKRLHSELENHDFQ